MTSGNGLKNALQTGDLVMVSGEVKWGERDVRVATRGVVESWKKGTYALVTLDEVAGDRNVCIHVRKQYIEQAS